MIEAKLLAGKSSKEQLMNFLTAVEKTSNVSDAIMAAGERNSDHANTVVQWLINDGVIKVKALKGEIQHVHNMDRFNDPRYQKSLMERLQRLDVNVGTIGDMINEARSAAQELINSGYDAGTDRSLTTCLLYTSPIPRDISTSPMPSSA